MNRAKWRTRDLCVLITISKVWSYLLGVGDSNLAACILTPQARKIIRPYMTFRLEIPAFLSVLFGRTQSCDKKRAKQANLSER